MTSKNDLQNDIDMDEERYYRVLPFFQNGRLMLNPMILWGFLVGFVIAVLLYIFTDVDNWKIFSLIEHFIDTIK